MKIEFSENECSCIACISAAVALCAIITWGIIAYHS